MSTFPFPDISPSNSSIEYSANTAKYVSPINGATQTVDRGGERLSIRLNMQNLNGSERSQMMGFISRLNGQQHRFTCRDHSYNGPTGNLSATELVDVPFDATNWEVTPATPDRGDLTDVTGGVRFTTTQDSTGVVIRPTGAGDGISTPTAGVSYAATISAGVAREGNSGQSSGVSLRWRDGTFGTSLSQSGVMDGARIVSGVTSHTSSDNALFLRPDCNYEAGFTDGYGASVDMYNLSAARCLLVDNGVNVLTYSEQLDNSDWSKVRTTITANADDAPDGNTTADEVVEDSTPSSSHYILQSKSRTSAAEFWTVSFYLKENTSQRVRVWVDDGGSSNYGQAYFDANTGTITGGPSSVGTADYAIASIDDVGDGWYRCRLSAYIPATTTARTVIYLCDGATNTSTFSGDGTSGLYIWGVQLQKGSQAGRYIETTTAAATGTSQTGTELFVKGLDHGVAQQLLAGDQVEVNGQLCILQDDVTDDGSGCGRLVVSPRIRNATSDEDPVILYQPHGTFMLDDNSVRWSNRPGVFSDLSITAYEDITL